MVRRWHADPFGFLRPWNEVPALIGSAPPATPPLHVGCQGVSACAARSPRMMPPSGVRTLRAGVNPCRDQLAEGGLIPGRWLAACTRLPAPPDQ